MDDHPFNDKVSELMRRRPRLSRDDAIDAVAVRYPDLHQQFLYDTNDDPRAQRLIAEKYGHDDE